MLSTNRSNSRVSATILRQFGFRASPCCKKSANWVWSCACGPPDLAKQQPVARLRGHTYAPARSVCEVVVVTWFRQHYPSLCRAYTHANRIQGVIARMLLRMSRFALPSVLSWSRCTTGVFEQYAAYSSSSSQNSARKASRSFDQICSMMPCFCLFVCSLHRECML